MTFRSWGNGFAAAGLVLAAAAMVLAQIPTRTLWYWVSWFTSVTLALLAVYVLRPRENEVQAQRIAYLRSRTSDRDMAFLLAGSRAITYPATLSEHSVSLAPRGETWGPEDKEEAESRARKLISLGLLEERGSEVETTALGRAVVAFDEAIKAKRRTDGA